MKVSFLILNLGVRGSVRRVMELANRLTRRGHDVTVYAGDGTPCTWLPTECRVLPQEQVVDNWHDALIYFSEPLHLEWMKRADATQKIIYVLGMDQNHRREMRLTFHGDREVDRKTACVRYGLNNFRIIVNCTAITNWLHSIGYQAYTVPGGVNFETFKPGLAERIPRLVTAGGAKRAHEGTQEVLDVMKVLKDRGIEAGLFLYAYRGLPQTDLAAAYCRADVFLDAQRLGGWNNPVAEAMACGTPVVCTDIWGNYDMALNEQTALMVKVGDVEGMADAIIRLFLDGELRERLVKAALAQIAPFTWDRATDALEAALEEMGKC